MLCICGLCYFIAQIYMKWEKSPVIIVKNTNPTMIYKIPFPAITICPENKSLLRKFNYAETYRKLMNNSTNSTDGPSEQDLEYFEAMSHVCDHEIFQATRNDLWTNKAFMNKTGVKLIQELAVPMNEALIGCFLMNYNHFNCNTIFNDIITEDGVCFTYNIVKEIFRNETIHHDYIYFNQSKPLHHWNWDRGYYEPNIEESYPHRMNGAGIRRAITIILKQDIEDINYVCRATEASKVTLHLPIDFPKPYKNYVNVPLGSEVIIEIKPKMFITSEKIRGYRPQRRQCYYNSERHLKYFETYSEHNCRLECIANLTYHRCGCIKYSLPRSADIPICGASNLECYELIWTDSDNLMAHDIYLLEYFPEQYVRENSVLQCDCMPECNAIEYKYTTTLKTFNAAQFLKDQLIDIEVDANKSRFAMITIYFKNVEFVADKRMELYGVSDLISNFGGLLGLFLGGSVLSLIEIIYFCTIRRCGPGPALKENDDL